MNLNTILIILGIIALIILVAHGLWANRREKSQYFKNANTFSREARLREPPPQVSAASTQPMPVSPVVPLEEEEVSPQQQTFPFDGESTTVMNDTRAYHQENEHSVDRAVENIKISLPNNTQASYHARVEPMPSFSEPALTTLEEAERYTDQEMGVDTHSADLRRQLAELAHNSTDIPLSSLQEMPPIEEPQDTDEEIKKAETDRTHTQAQQEAPSFIMMYVVAPENYQFQGAKLAKILDELGFLFGERNIYHRHSDLSVSSPILFSVANIQQPGTFDYNMNDFSTIGIALFMQLPSEGNDLMNLRMMIRAAKSIAEDLGGFVLTDKQEMFDDAAEQAYLAKVK
ncbi:cell division protein ZipA [Pasteurella sp. PK-2025]|uniref:cell division protein ZipA n=1 Tax=unclassified Pasteurella TaxID=2621516 RepID=UPI003C7769E0